MAKSFDISKKMFKILEAPPKLLQYKYKDVNFFYTRDMKEERKLNNTSVLDLMVSETVKNFLELNKGYSELIEAYAKKNKLEKIAILMAHGEEVNKKWYYANEDRTFPVQSWINKMDGKYKVLIMYSCNPGRNEITSKKSPILVPNRTYSNALLEKGKVQIELFLPKTGYVDSYLIKEELKKLKK